MKNIATLILTFLGILFIYNGIIQAQGYNFSADSVLNTGYGPESILSKDFNNDNHPDLAVAMRDDPANNHIAIYFNDGNGVFNDTPDSTYLMGDIPRGLASGDFNNDNIYDLVTINLHDSTVGIFLGNSDGTFNAMDFIDIPSEGRNLNVGDFDNDQNDDIAVITRYAQLYILKGNGDGTFVPPVYFPSGGNGNDIEIYDMNDDNYLDIIVGFTNNHSVNVFINDSTGGFPSMNSVYAYRTPWFVEVCDLNSDNEWDIVTGSGSYESDNVLANIGQGGGIYTISDTASPGTYVADIKACDLNGDGHTDVIVGDRSGFYILTGNGSGTFIATDTIDYDAFNYQTKKVIAKDLNSDGTKDVIIARDNKISIFYNHTVPNSIEGNVQLTTSFELLQNYPNPFNPETTIKYSLLKTAQVELSVFNQIGQKVATLINGKQNSGNHSKKWNASHFASGTYYYRLKVNENVQIKKMLLIK